MRLKAGDRVVAVGEYLYAGVKPGETGTVIIVENDTTIGVRWDNYHEDAHDCNSPELCEIHYGTYVGNYEIDLLHEEDFLEADAIQTLVEEMI